MPRLKSAADIRRPLLKVQAGLKAAAGNAAHFSGSGLRVHSA